MDSSQSLNWGSEESVVSLNPRQSQEENRKLHQLAEQFPLKNHIWIASSGSSAQANESVKLIALSRQAFLKSAAAVNQHLKCTSNDIWLQALPNFHVGGLSIQARAYLSKSKVVFLERWDALSFYELVELEKVTLSALVPTQVFDLVQSGLKAPSSLKAIVIGGSFLSDKLYQQALDLGWPLLPSYGMTECCSQIATASLENLKNRNRDLQILSHVKAKINSDGLLQIQSESLLTGIAQWKDGKAQFWDPKVDGWYQTSDYCEVNGQILIPQGRGSDFVKISGEGVNLAKLQEQLENLAQKMIPNRWTQVAIVAQTNSRTQYQVELASTLTKSEVEELIQRFNSQVAPYERIKDFKNISEIPRTDLGKLAREKLKQLICS